MLHSQTMHTQVQACEYFPLNTRYTCQASTYSLDKWLSQAPDLSPVNYSNYIICVAVYSLFLFTDDIKVL